jgi:hypothetical protein
MVAAAVAMTAAAVMSMTATAAAPATAANAYDVIIQPNAWIAEYLQRLALRRGGEESAGHHQHSRSKS